MTDKRQRTKPERRSLSRVPAKPLTGRGARLFAFDTPAFMEARTIFPTTVRPESEVDKALKSGFNSAKIGAVVRKGRWKDLPVYSLTLEERATCPRSCRHWRSCAVRGTRVLTADLRWVQIESLVPGERIVGFDEEPPSAEVSRRSRIAVVEAVGRETKPCVRIVTDKGEITVSTDHLFVAKRDAGDYRWFSPEELLPGHVIQHIAAPWDEERSYGSGDVRRFFQEEPEISASIDGCNPQPRVRRARRTSHLPEENNAVVRSKELEGASRQVSSDGRPHEVAQFPNRGGWRETLRFLGTFRPIWLLDRAEDLIADRVLDGPGATPARILSIEPAGDRDVVAIATSTKTLITEGFLSHNCYGNNMHLAERVRAGPDLERRLERELGELAAEHRKGFVVRLHVLGDFYSVEYVEFWRRMLPRHVAMRVFGYSARWEYGKDAIATALIDLAQEQWTRFAIRFSNAPFEGCATVSVEHPFQVPADAILCPAQVGKTESCTTCALCWQTTRRIAFLQH